MVTLAQTLGFDVPQAKKVEVSEDLARRILSQYDNLSIKKVAEICGCSTLEVRTVYRDEKMWRQRLNLPQARSNQGHRTKKQEPVQEPKEVIEMGDKNLQALREKYPTLKALLKSKEGKTVKEWEVEHGLNNTYFYQLKKEYEAQMAGNEEKKALTLSEALAVRDELEGEVLCLKTIQEKEEIRLTPQVAAILINAHMRFGEKLNKLNTALDKVVINL